MFYINISFLFKNIIIDLRCFQKCLSSCALMNSPEVFVAAIGVDRTGPYGHRYPVGVPGIKTPGRRSRRQRLLVGGLKGKDFLLEVPRGKVP